MNFRTKYNRKEQPKGEVNTLPSMTVPDQSMSIQEIVRRYASGLPLGGERVPFYMDEDTDLPDLSKMDKIERLETLRELADEYTEKTTKIKNAQKDKAKKEAEKQLRDQLRKELEEEQKIPTHQQNKH